MSDDTTTCCYGNGRIAQTNTTTEYFLGDALGSVRQLSMTDGEISLAQSYDPYGNVTFTSGGGTSPFAYTGEQQDASGLTYLRARYYSPLDGRFLSRDTWSGDYNNPLSLNRWMYVQGNPINYTDPTGLIKKSESRNAEVILDKLHHWYNISIKKDWGYLNQFINTNNRYINESLIDCNQWVPGNWRSLRELQLTLHAVNKMSNELGGRGAFLSAMRWQPIRIYRIPARTFFGYGGYSINNVILPDNPFDTSDLKGKRLIIHELLIFEK